MLHRRIRDSYIGTLPPNWRWVFIELIMGANWEKKKWHAGKGRLITVERGEQIVSLRTLAARAGVSRSCVVRALDALERGGTIETEAGQRWTKVRICNYDEYQHPERDSETPVRQQKHGGKTDSEFDSETQLNKETTVTKKQKIGRPHAVTDSVIEFLNRKAGRRLCSEGYDKQVRRLLKEGFSERDMRMVVWWAVQEWGSDPSWKKRITPSTLFKLQSPNGARTFPQYLAEAREKFEESE